MENISKNSNNAGRSLKSSRPSKPDNRWTILFIGNHGKTITLKRFKGMVLLTFLVLCISIAITVGLLLLSLNMRREKNQLESNLKNLEQQIKDLRYEKDVIMTKLVLAESRTKKDPAKKPQKQNLPLSTEHNNIDRKQAKPPELSAKTFRATPVNKVDEPTPAVIQTEPAPRVAIENFKVSPKANENLLRVQFKIKNTSPNSQRVSGHAIVVLKGNQLQQNKWLTIPRMPLSDGKPTGKQRGYAFGIKNFKAMSFKTNLPQSLKAYQSATVYVFTKKGELLLEQDFPVNLPEVPQKIASKPAQRSSSASSVQPTFGLPPALPSTPPTAEVQPSTDESVNTLKNSSSQ
ncbi:MAG: hypothetical protein JRF56_03950 [Deltaproteobacteria bacterium]|jgi:hypothetical protein|nr:hypothetical protein [Deltaproteobacteria bacterium]